MDLKKVKALLALYGLKARPIAYVSGERWVRYDQEEQSRRVVKLETSKEELVRAGISSMVITPAPEKEEPVEVTEAEESGRWYSVNFDLPTPPEEQKQLLNELQSLPTVCILHLANNAYILAECLDDYGKN